MRATRAAAPSRRSEPLALALVFLGAGAAVVAVFHDRIGSIQLGKDGIKIDLDAGRERRARRRSSSGSPRAEQRPRRYARGLDRYLAGASPSRRRAAAACRRHRPPG